jgi:two-component system, response regulator YesN
MNFKVIIADDNCLILESLKSTISWETLNCELIGEAVTGLDAKELIMKFRPDIVITDIRMPGMDGLEVSEFVKSLGCRSEIIVITGYHEFEYAQKALKLGVFDFVLKPINNQNLENIIKKAIEKIEAECNKEELHKKLIVENDLYKQEIDRSKYLLKEKLLLELIQGRSRYSEELDGKLSEYGLKKWEYVLTIGKIRTVEEEVCMGVINIFLTCLEEYQGEYEILDVSIGQEMGFVFLNKKKKSAYTQNLEIRKILQAANRKAKEQYFASVCFAISQISKDIKKLNELKIRSKNVLEASFFSVQENIIYTNNYNLITGVDGNYIIKDLDSFYRILEHSKEEEIEQEICFIVSKIKESTKGNEFKIKCLLSEICITLYRHFCLNTLPQEEFSMDVVLNEIDQLMDIQQSQEYLMRFVKMIKKIIVRTKTYNNPLVGETVNYIRKSYTDSDISLTKAADSMNVNASYLSRLLKKETGMNFIDILTHIRISMAKQLLEEPGSKAAEVGEKVGYNDYTYFYQVFKKVESVSPMEYKKNKKRI